MTVPVFVFDSTHHALWAEQVALEAGLAAQVIPAPAETRARCALALETLPEDLGALAAALRRAGVEFGLHPDPGTAGASG
jgi:hypothetical protein